MATRYDFSEKAQLIVVNREVAVVADRVFGNTGSQTAWRTIIGGIIHANRQRVARPMRSDLDKGFRTSGLSQEPSTRIPSRHRVALGMNSVKQEATNT